MTSLRFRTPGSPLGAWPLSRTVLILSGIALFGISGAALADGYTGATGSTTGSTTGTTIQDEPGTTLGTESEAEQENLDTSSQVSPGMGSDYPASPGAETEFEEDPDLSDDTPSFGSPAMSPSPGAATEYEMEDMTSDSSLSDGSIQNGSQYEMEDATATTQSAPARPGSEAATATPGHETAATFPEVRPVESKAQFRPTLGILAGYQNVRGEVNGAPGFGVDAGFNILVPVSVGVQVQYSPSDVDVGNLKANFDTTNYLARAYYNFGGDINVVKNTYIGWKAGITRYSGATDADSDTSFSLGPVLGMDFPVDRNKKFTIGPEASYLSVLDNDDQFSLAAAARYWF